METNEIFWAKINKCMFLKINNDAHSTISEVMSPRLANVWMTKNGSELWENFGERVIDSVCSWKAWP
jgi:hypothetical protein